MIRTLIVDDDQLFRTGLRMILESASEAGVSVVGEAADGVEGVSFVAANPVDVVLMDLSMPGLDGIEATRRITARGETPRVLVLTTYALDGSVAEAIRAGASGFLLKDTPPDALVAAIASTHNGTAVVSPALTRQLIAEHTTGSGPSTELQHALSELTERETEVLTLIGRGLNNTEIAAELFIAEVTVKTHVGRVLRKLDARDRVQAVVLAYEAGLVAP